jgi:periplasmic mercuric ion binding protein
MKTTMKSVLAIFALLFFISFTASAQDSISSGKTAVIKIQTSAVCGSCKTRIEKNMAFEKGVTDVVLDLDTKIVTITYRPTKTSPDKLRLALSKIGYDADNVLADPTAYEKLPPCCKKGGMD